MSDEPDKRSALSIGMEWGTRITSIGLEFALPPALGFTLDWKLKTGPWLTVIGAFLGLTMGMIHVFRLASQLPGGSDRPFRGRGPRPPDDSES